MLAVATCRNRYNNCLQHSKQCDFTRCSSNKKF